MRPVLWSKEAHRDNLEILRYIAEDNPDAAERVVDAIEDAGKKLGEFATGRPGRITGTYEKSLTRFPYIISYELRSIAGRESVVILRVIHTARDWPAEE
ncbi:type II toxin-antitoxin system RelE/ParE family toxin [Rhizobium leguminosarum]|uniref:type II toxin-antitoxin system RelE/ParE family toxin n=1 Tax=Rhizobium leguminosarum TaxID=384 RepID=UPI0014427D7A|nr:type II toxin-antitoxin system RelE/ParE family toxin [Rhizobium leguminosarum]NKK63357.1 type II toxin-antitoxin system RelE/ParE family toxin [Rhizobium leguminosarum bv. viciae]NKL07180.1 type II toxin-antitoxin system RelE/ParE family toxin [Rhizobium leguminosarum bv. viciae]NKL88014.1 type II toxin-antitoxin system RelE/ParE family toxin [Rhizobium leguminosarum bv. viciae]NKL89813.1 type II toxin-antitoxin system RelE/ParE family toxin [Rhizobium leguminosarum bv. viciae]NKM93259.1 t